MSIPRPRAAITGIGGTRLSDAERELFAALPPLGFILMGRNISEPAQVIDLTAELRDVVGRSDAPILIDQEGGRVQRLRPPHWRSAPPSAVFGELYRQDADSGLEATWLNARLMAAELYDLGINVDCAPVVDVRRTDAHDVIGDRAFDTDPEIVSVLGRAVISGLVAGGVTPIIKHIPGHGRAMVDSHFDLPAVDADLDDLDGSDFIPFQMLADEPCWAMTAHIRYGALDGTAAATLSPVVVEAIRERLGFSGVLISDDLAMQALEGGMTERTRGVFAAGCDLSLLCNGDLAELTCLLEASPELPAKTEARLLDCAKSIAGPVAFDRSAGIALLDELLAGIRR